MEMRGSSGRKRASESGRLRSVVRRGRARAYGCVRVSALALGTVLSACFLAAQSPQAARVVLDAAHGGEDVGATLADGSGSVQEKAVTVALVQQLRSLLGARGFSVVLTRTGDGTVDADSRASTANHAGALACLSLHATEAGSGVHLFVSSVAPSPEALLTPWKTAQSARVTQSLKLASELNNALAGAEDGNQGESGTQGDSGIQGKGTAAPGSAIPVTLGRTTLPGIDSMTCPAVAVELAPLRDAKGKIVLDVTASDYQRRVLGALAAGLLAWRGDAEGGNPR